MFWIKSSYNQYIKHDYTWLASWAFYGLGLFPDLLRILRGGTWGLPTFLYAWAASTMLFPSLSEFWYQIWTFGFYELGLFGAVLGWFFFGPSGWLTGVGQPLPCSPPSFKTLYYKILAFDLKNFRFYGLGLFWGFFGTPRGGTWGCPQSLMLEHLPPCFSLFLQRL